MKNRSQESDGSTRKAAPLAFLGTVALLATVAPLNAAVATPSTGGEPFYAAPEGQQTGACEDAQPCSIERVQELARQAALEGGGGVTVILADGIYRITEPLEFRPEDGGSNGHTVQWTAAPEAHPVITGATEISGWSEHEDGIFVADTEPGLDSRQLYVNGTIAPRASMLVDSSDLTVTPTGMTIEDPDLAFLSDLPNQGRIELQALGDFTNRYSPVESIDGTTVTMAQPAWDNNTWGRSEEHTSELQSRGHLVCRLLLEKKKINRQRQG